MKLIDADRLKEELIKCFVTNKRVLKAWLVNTKLACDTIDEQPEVLISCPKCHGKGTYDVPSGETVWGEDGFYEKTEWKSRHCELCYGTGKVTVEFYEDIQRGARDENHRRTENVQ